VVATSAARGPGADSAPNNDERKRAREKGADEDEDEDDEGRR